MRGLLMTQGSSLAGALLVIAFAILFAGLVAAVYRRAGRAEMERGAQLPFEE